MALRAWLAAALLLATLVGVTNGQARNATICTCPETEDPVCADDSQTYLNECIANCHRVQIVSKGECNCSLHGCLDRSCITKFDLQCYRGLTYTDDCEARYNGLCPSCRVKPGICEQPGGGTSVPTEGGMAASDFDLFVRTAWPNPWNPKFNYAEALHKMFLFYESMRAGKLPSRRMAWRGDSDLGVKGKHGEDLSGGYLEAGGSYMKMMWPIAYTATMLSWAVESYGPYIEKVGEMEPMIGAIRWATDHLNQSHVTPDEVAVQVGTRTVDFLYYGPPEDYEAYAGERPVGYVGAEDPASQPVAESAAAMAAAARAIWRHGGGREDPSYVNLLLEKAESFYALATGYPVPIDNVTDPLVKNNHAFLFGSPNVKDQLAWAATWLYIALGKEEHLADARKYYDEVEAEQNPYNGGWAFDVKSKYPALHVLLAKHDPDPERKAIYMANAKLHFDMYLNKEVPHTTKGLAYPYHWGSLRVASNEAFIAFHHSLNQAVPLEYRQRLFTYGLWQIQYILGDSGRSWVVGFGEDYPTHFWHKPSYNAYIDWPLRDEPEILITTTLGPWAQDAGLNGTDIRFYASQSEIDFKANNEPQRFIAYGALYGAPLPDDSLIVGRKDYSYTESTIDSNAGLTAALSHLVAYYSRVMKPFDPCGLDLGWGHPNASTVNADIPRCPASGGK